LDLQQRTSPHPLRLVFFLALWQLQAWARRLELKQAPQACSVARLQG
jgi:hypothetical protein